MINDAEKFKEEDEKRRAEIDIKNEADTVTE